MSVPFLGEIRLMAFDYAPRGWSRCDGQLLPINQNQALFSLLGFNFGGNGQTNFALPDYRGRVPIHMGNGFTMGQRGGEESHTLTASEMPVHTHTLQASAGPATAGTQPGSNLLGTAGAPMYKAPQQSVALQSDAVGNAGATQAQAHLNLQPYLTLNFCISLQGIFPSQT